MATILRPPLITRIERAIPSRSLLDLDRGSLLLTTLKSQDKVYGSAGKVPSYDWQNPWGRQYPVALRTWTDPLKLNLLGKDQFFSGAGVGPDYDYPNPRGRQHPVGLRSWDQGNLLSTLLGITIKPFSLSDWPVPRGYGFPQENRSYIDVSEFWMLKDKFFGAAGQPPANLDWPVPKGPTPSIELRTYIDASEFWMLKDKFFGLAGNPNFDWPNPRGATPAIQLRTFIDETKIQLIGQDTFFGAPGQPPTYTWINPTRQSWRIVDQPNDSLITLLSAVVVPFSLLDWPNPQMKAPAISLRTFTDPTKIQLIGKDQFFQAAGMGPKYDYPNPRGRQFPMDLRGFVERFLKEPDAPVAPTFFWHPRRRRRQ